ncbi:MAG: hypothetical protein SPJ59_00705 [Peptoniphilaceae bacterium]|nr:hypothetical protein [Peptoniphilaceae bacterium]MDY6147255.1 hypothetical protein [Peptoniphilaceae bacterium]
MNMRFFLISWILLGLWIVCFEKALEANRYYDNDAVSGRKNRYVVFVGKYFFTEFQEKMPKTYAKWLGYAKILYGERRAFEAMRHLLIRAYGEAFFYLLFSVMISAISPVFSICMLALPLVRIASALQKLKKDAKLRIKSIERSLPDLLAGWVLSLKAGMTPTAVWEKREMQSASPLDQEIQRITQMMQEGVSRKQAYLRFGEDFAMEDLRECGRLFSQYMELGGNELCIQLEEIRRKAVERRIRIDQKEAEKASQQMIFPSLLLFIGILILVMTPILGQW